MQVVCRGKTSMDMGLSNFSLAYVPSTIYHPVATGQQSVQRIRCSELEAQQQRCGVGGRGSVAAQSFASSFSLAAEMA